MAGSAKPSPKIFKYALDQHALDPDEAIHIGDSIKEDIEGARQANMLSILVDREIGDDKIKNNVIKQLNQVPEILEKIKVRNSF